MSINMNNVKNVKPDVLEDLIKEGMKRRLERQFRKQTALNRLMVEVPKLQEENDGLRTILGNPYERRER